MTSIFLSQIEAPDLPLIKGVLSSDFRNFSDFNSELSVSDVMQLYKESNNENNYMFSIKITREEDYKRTLCGVCGISDIDWISRNGKLMFWMVDVGGFSASPQDYVTSRLAFSKLLAFGFKELNLYKLSFEVFDGNDVQAVLGDLGFVAEGVRRQAKFKRGKYIDTTVFSLVSQEFK